MCHHDLSLPVLKKFWARAIKEKYTPRIQNVIHVRAQDITIVPEWKVNLVFATGFLGYLNIEDIKTFFTKVKNANIPQMLLRESINPDGTPDTVDYPQQYIVRVAKTYRDLISNFEGAEL